MKTALVTGASSGIGREIAIAHAKNQGDLVVVARRKEELELLKSELEEQYEIKVMVIAQDLIEDGAAQKVFDLVQSKNIQIDYVINNAGFGDYNYFKNTTLDHNKRMINLNVTALTEFCHIYTQYWIENKIPGKIMNVASTAAFQGTPHVSVYAATKAFVLSLSESLALELKKDNITLTALCPGPTKTDFAANTQMDQALAQHKMLPTAEDVAVYGYKKMLAGKTIAVQGLLNKAGANSAKFVPRKFASAIAGKVMKRAGGK
jgi:short-subunit dehydrogenase